MSGLQLRKVRKQYNDIQVTRDVDLDISPGEFVVFVGPSGCGKSTLLRLIAGLDSVTSGEIFIGGRDVTNSEPAQRGIAMVFQSYALYPHMNVRENMSFGLKMNGLKAEEIERRVTSAASILHLENLLDRKPKALSGGQRQRVAIGRAIVREPEVFLFDEPLSNLDAELRVQMRLEIAKLHKELGSTMIYVTHDQVEAMTLADKIVVLRAGRIEQVGSPIELYDNPDNLFVAGFIGSPKMNFLGATVTAVSESNFTVQFNEWGETQCELPALSQSLTVGQNLILGIRPEHFVSDSPVELQVSVDVVENLGGTAFAYAGTESSSPLVIEVDDLGAIQSMSEYRAGIDPARVCVFDPITELRIR